MSFLSNGVLIWCLNPAGLRMSSDGTVLRAMPGLSKPRVRFGSDSEFGWMWLQRAGRCADSSFLSMISVTDRGLVARGNGEKGREEGSYECGVGSVSRR